MLKYKLKENSIQPNSSQPIKDYLMSLGIQKLESFLKAPQAKMNYHLMTSTTWEQQLICFTKCFRAMSLFFFKWTAM